LNKVYIVFHFRGREMRTVQAKIDQIIILAKLEKFLISAGWTNGYY
jgi:hypothetical protein